MRYGNKICLIKLKILNVSDEFSQHIIHEKIIWIDDYVTVWVTILNNIGKILLKKANAYIFMETDLKY